ncbi:NADPH-dependent FMN reductase [Streptosporangium carneum]|uniref:FMN reductase n=1 Tax=Streptosporangium carneum TaxID=47481 RepID=A0A9W6IA54_9ACTN|nr:NADPH-dependent FMN reductase [Streptosporangium carneum]GLK14926.1 FMN reductase [Streptosporangium carneum]
MRPTLLVIAGSVRRGSVSDAVARTAAALTSESHVVRAYGETSLLPHFNPDLEGDGLPEVVTRLRSALATADAFMFCTPEYAGALPGALKNLLEWAIGGWMYRKPAGWINTSTAPSAAARAHESLHTVLNYTGALVIPDACVRLPIDRALVTPTGLIPDDRVTAGIIGALETLSAAVTGERT